MNESGSNEQNSISIQRLVHHVCLFYKPSKTACVEWLLVFNITD